MDEPLVDLLIDTLERSLEDEHLSICGLAQRLGFSGAHLSMVLSHRRRPGLRLIRAVIAAYPSYAEAVAEALCSKHTGEPEAGVASDRR